MAEGQALEVVIHDPGSSKQIDYPEWLNETKEDTSHNENNKQGTRPKIAKIPKVLRSLREVDIWKPKCYYDPEVVSIGPYHHHRKDLKVTEEHKKRMARQFVNTSGKSGKALYTEVKEVANNAKEYYEGNSTANLSDEEFEKMIFLDGCFILQFIHCVTSNDPRDYKSLKMSDQMVASVRQDLLLLENQLPYVVLDALITSRKNWWSDRLNRFIKIREPESISSFMFIVYSLGILFIFLCCWPLLLIEIKEERTVEQNSEDNSEDNNKKAKDETRSEDNNKKAKNNESATNEKENKEGGKPMQDGSNPSHLLDYLYSQIIDQQEETKASSDKKLNGENSYANAIHGQHLYFSAKYLKKVGIHFRKSPNRGLKNVKFKSFWDIVGKVSIPPMTISELNKSMLLNLVAYEASLGEDVKHWVTSYICFIDSLIDDADDVRELRSNGIIVNYYGADKKVADLFNTMAKPLMKIEALKPNAYNDIISKINQLSESRPAQWIAEVQEKHLKNPLLFAVVAFAIILTFIQTYMAVFPRDK